MKYATSCLALVLFALPHVHAADEGGAIQCGNLIYAGNNTSRCFSDAFLEQMQRRTTIATEKRFKAVKLDSDELFSFPFVVMTGESDFRFTAKERENLRKYLENGGFLLASAGCSSEVFDRAFRANLKQVFEGEESPKLEPIAKDHLVFSTVQPIRQLDLGKSNGEGRLEGLTIGGKLVVVYSGEGLNDTANTSGCCCCGGNEIVNAMEVNMNILMYALLH